MHLREPYNKHIAYGGVLKPDEDCSEAILLFVISCDERIRKIGYGTPEALVLEKGIAKMAGLLSITLDLIFCFLLLDSQR